MKWLETVEYGLLNLDWYSQIKPPTHPNVLILKCVDGEVVINVKSSKQAYTDIIEFLGSDSCVLEIE